MCDHILHPVLLRKLARKWLLEDCGNFNVAGAPLATDETQMTIFMKGPGVLAGVPFAEAVFSELDLRARWLFEEGDSVRGPAPVAHVLGAPGRLLLAERVVLNLLSRASGVASGAARLRLLLDKKGFRGAVAGTRKTTPGFRMVEKYALSVGGADTHRYDLSGMAMVKDNHVDLAGSVTKAVAMVRRTSSFTTKIEVECRSLEQAVEACQAKCDVVMFDNFTPEAFKQAARTLKAQFPHILIEASGGISEENAEQYATPFTDVISCSSLVQGYRTVDFSMKFTPPVHSKL